MLSRPYVVIALSRRPSQIAHERLRDHGYDFACDYSYAFKAWPHSSFAVDVFTVYLKTMIDENAKSYFFSDAKGVKGIFGFDPEGNLNPSGCTPLQF